jgi:tetratricopeptide (TPR) repeat protein
VGDSGRERLSTPSGTDEATESSPAPWRPTAPAVDPEVTRPLEPGVVLGDRYRVVRFVAQGGMGEVYEAEDLQLGERVALKRLRPEVARSRRAIERFKREIQLARRVTHPNICRIFDLGVFTEIEPGVVGQRATDGEPVVFLTMELLDGQTLAERIRADRTLTVDAALPIAEQMIRALAALHEAGIVHRDFKSQNVLLVAPGGRVVVTDFGLARVASGEQITDGASATGAMVGSPATMAPEQVEGRKVTAAADVYALGVVLFEMVTGELPFRGPTRLATAFKRLREAPPSPRSLSPNLDARWEAAILRCLEFEPEARFASVGDVLAALTGERPRRPMRVPRWAIGVASAAALAALTAGLVAHRRSIGAESSTQSSSGPGASERRRAVAVLGFKNLSGRPETAWLSTAVSEMLRTELASADEVRLVPGESVARMKADLSLVDADSFAADTLSRIREHLAADYVVLGSIAALGDDGARKVRLDVRVQDTRSGELLASVSETATEAELLDAVTRVGGRLRRSLHVEPAAAPPDRATAALFGSPEAARLYAEGLARLRTFDGVGARDLLERVVALVPEHPLPHSALAQALGELGFEQQAAVAARHAYERAGGLPREERLLVEGRYHEAARNWDRAIATYRTLCAEFPGNLDYGLRLASAQVWGGAGGEAMTTVDILRRLPPPAADDPRLDLMEAWATPDYRVQHAAASRAAEKGRARGARLLVAEAEISLAFAHVYLGEPDQAAAAADRARQLFFEVGNRVGAAWALHAMANVFRSRGDVNAAIANHEEAARIARENGALHSAAASLTRAAWGYGERGDLTTAWQRHAEAARLTGPAADGSCVAGNALLEGWLRFLQGDLETAARVYARAAEMGQPCAVNDEIEVRLGDVSFVRGDLADARARFERALGTFEKNGLAVMAAVLRLGVAHTVLEERRPAEAEPLIRDVLATAQRSKNVVIEARAVAALARALSAQGKAVDAREAILRATTMGAGIQDLGTRMAIAVASLEVRAEARDEARLRELLSEAQQSGVVPLALEARGALWTHLARGSRRAEALRELAGVERDARTRGFGLVARRAAEAAAKRAMSTPPPRVLESPAAQQQDEEQPTPSSAPGGARRAPTSPGRE